MRNFTLKFNSLFDLRAAFPTEKSCIRFLEQIRWNGNIISPFDPTSKVYKRNDGSYRCKNSGKNFNARIGTIFESSKLPLRKWFMAIYMLTSNKKGVSSMQLAKDIHVTQKTAWFLTQRIRETFTRRTSDKLTGEVELDETFVGGKNKNRHWNKKAKKCQGRSFVDKVPVLGMLERGGRVICKVVRNTSYKQLTAPILRNVERNAMLYMDEWVGYKTVQKVYRHAVVDHGHGIYVADGGVYTNTIEAFWSNYCKRAIIGTYNYLSRKHLQRYFDEFSFRYNTRKVKENERFGDYFLHLGGHITYNQLIQKS